MKVIRVIACFFFVTTGCSGTRPDALFAEESPDSSASKSAPADTDSDGAARGPEGEAGMAEPDDAAPSRAADGVDGGSAQDASRPVTCPGSQKLCGAACASFNDPSTGCGNATCAACPAAPVGTPACDNGVCSVTCPAGYNRCQGRCVLESATNCGASCSSCQRPHTSAACSLGQCATRCAGGFLDCDNNPANGCETDGNSDPSNCGACSSFCSGICTGGRCTNGGG